MTGPASLGACGVRLWVVVPAFDEQAGIARTIAALAAQRDRDFHLVVVDNASTDDTARETERACTAYASGWSCRRGMRSAASQPR